MLKYLNIAALVLFFAGTVVLNVGNYREARFDWPDESMNYFFAVRIARDRPIPAYDADIARTENLLHPRSFNVINSSLVPGGFLGLPVIYGLTGRVIGSAGILFLTPILAVVAVLALVSIVRRVFDDRLAWLTGILAFTNPALIYYSSFAMLPNVAFVALILLGFSLLCRPRGSGGPGDRLDSRFSAKGGSASGGRGNDIVMVVSGLLIGLGLFIRTSEALVVGLVVVGFLAWLIRQKQFLRATLFVAGIIIALLPMFILQNQLYGSPFSTGYARFQDTAGEIAVAPQGVVATGIKALILPFGFNASVLARNVWHSFFALFWWVTIPMLIGLAYWLQGRPTRKQWLYAGAWTASGAILLIMYGNWLIGDAFIRSVNTIGLSYVRYWLPVTLLALPFVALFYRWLWTQRRWAAVMVFILTTVMSIYTVYWGTPESLLHVRARIQDYHRASDIVQEKTPNNAIIIAVRTDKIVFPERRVIAAWTPLGRDEKLMRLAPRLAVEYPLYLYARLTDDEQREVVASFGMVGLTLAAIVEPRAGETLYEIVSK